MLCVVDLACETEQSQALKGQNGPLKLIQVFPVRQKMKEPNL